MEFDGFIGRTLMALWLLKTEPTDYSYADLERDRKTVWDGVSNNLALKNLRAMKKGDKVLIYYTGDEKQLVGMATVVSDPYPDPKEGDPRLVVVDVRPSGLLDRPVTLAEIKQDKALKSFDLVRLPRLSVVPVSEEQWAKLLKLSGG
jgi:predicted RNA-binding protein with PUA-like domain